ncbi:MAG: 16S rRNA (uracil(1498)-N(3))-methyltransferase [Gammaproteobacteria bacterium]
MPRKPHLYLDQPLREGERITLPAPASHHVARVLRMRPGQELVLFNNTGGEYVANIISIERKTVEVEVASFRNDDRESILHITLVQGISRGQHMDYTLQKAVELGVKRIVPAFTEYGNVRLDGQRLTGKIDHWHGLIINACEQCGRNRLPVLDSPIAVTDWIEQDQNRTKLILHPGGVRGLSGLPCPQGPLSLLAGPEGGFSESEISLAAQHDFVPVALGPRILRTETAALVGISSCQALWGDFV